MNFDHTDQQKALREEVIEFCRSSGINDGVDERDRAGEFPRALFEEIGEGLRLQGLTVPEEYGGRGLDPLTAIVGLEAFGYACEDSGLVFAVCAHLLATSVPVNEFGTDEQKRAVLPDLCRGKKVGVNSMTEPGAGSDVGSVAMTAVRDGDDYVLNGTKTLVTNGPAGDVGSVFAVTAPEAGLQSRLTGFLIDLDTPGITRGPQFDLLGKRTTPVGELEFKDVRLPASAVLGGREGIGFAVFNHAMNWERIGLFAAHVGTMQRLTESAVARARTRRQFGQPIGKNQAVAHTIVDMKVRLETARLLTYKAASRLDKARDVAMDASMTKYYVGESLVATARDHLQIFGGAGFLNETGAARPLRDSIGATLYSGTSEIQKNIIAAWLGL